MADIQQLVVELEDFDSSDALIVAIIKAFLLIGNHPASLEDVALLIQKYKLAPSNASKTAATLEKRIGKHQDSMKAIKKQPIINKAFGRPEETERLNALPEHFLISCRTKERYQLFLIGIPLPSLPFDPIAWNLPALEAVEIYAPEVDPRVSANMSNANSDPRLTTAGNNKRKKTSAPLDALYDPPDKLSRDLMKSLRKTEDDDEDYIAGSRDSKKKKNSKRPKDSKSGGSPAKRRRSQNTEATSEENHVEPETVTNQEDFLIEQLESHDEIDQSNLGMDQLKNLLAQSNAEKRSRQPQSKSAQIIQPTRDRYSDITRNDPIPRELLPPSQTIEFQGYSCSFKRYRAFPRCKNCFLENKIPCNFQDFRVFTRDESGLPVYGPYFSLKKLKGKGISSSVPHSPRKVSNASPLTSKPDMLFGDSPLTSFSDSGESDADGRIAPPKDPDPDATNSEISEDYKDERFSFDVACPMSRIPKEAYRQSSAAAMAVLHRVPERPEADNERVMHSDVRNNSASGRVLHTLPKGAFGGENQLDVLAQVALAAETTEPILHRYPIGSAGNNLEEEGKGGKSGRSSVLTEVNAVLHTIPKGGAVHAISDKISEKSLSSEQAPSPHDSAFVDSGDDFKASKQDSQLRAVEAI
ncbi:hypothetical protein HDU97_006785 [Phlyctochytrium planicorne]|nr:hypothetical protein HDU97_006785 [Phlyctochytrium planicorne]